jgi:hypothetical protein
LNYAAENDRIEDTSKLTPEDVRAIGSIRLTIYRATAKQRDIPEYYLGEREFVPDKLPEKILKVGT